MNTEAITVETTFDENTITQVMSFDPLSADCSRDVIMARSLELQEDAVRQALIKLGWTPPSRIILAH